MRRIMLFLFTLLLLAWWSRIYAQADEVVTPEPVILTDEQGSYPLGLHLEILEDPDGELTIEDVSGSEFNARFVPSQVEVPNYGFTKSTYWVRLKLRNESPAIDHWFLELDFAHMQYVDLYTPLPDGNGFSEKQTGALRPLASRDIPNPHMIFDLPIPTDGEQTFYLRFQNGASMTLPLILWQPLAFSSVFQLDQLRQGIFYGLMLGLLVYNLFLYLSLREKSYLYLVICLASILFYEATYSGNLELYVAPKLYYLKPYYMLFSLEIVFASIIFFSDSFLEVKSRFPRLHRVNIAIVGVWGVLIILIPFSSYQILVQLVLFWALSSFVAALAAGIISWRHGFHPARFYMFSWLGLIFTISIVILVRFGLVASTAFTENLYRFGIMWMAVSFSIALADRVNLLKAKTESANRDLQHSERRLSQILEAMPVGVVVYGADQRPNFANKRTAEILTNPSQGIGLDLSFRRTLDQAMTHFSFRIAGSDQRYPIEDFPVYRALHGEHATADDIEADLGDWRVPLEVWASPVKDEQGNIESTVVAFQDISTRKQKEAELDNYRNHLEQLVMQRTEELETINAQLTYEIGEREVLEELLQKRITWMSKFGLARQEMRGSADLPTAVEMLSAVILQLLEARLVFFISWDVKDKQVEFLYSQTQMDPMPNIERISTSFKKDSPLCQELELGKTIVLSADELFSMAASLGNCLEGYEWRSLLLAPAVAGELVTGVLGVGLPYPAHSLSQAENELVREIALDLANLAHDALFLDQSRILVASEERNRLARDLHDSVTQVLFSASLVAEVLPQIWRRDPALAMQSLEDLRRLTRGALAEMRTMLLELRPSAVAKTPLPDLLTQLTVGNTSRSALPFRLFIEQTPALPEKVHIGFYRIAQEALNNVTKHAQASQVTLSLSAVLLPQELGEDNTRHEVRLVIEDDGVGFSAQNETLGNLGLGIMQERAADIQASLTINSQIGQGTHLELTWCGVVKDD